MAQPRAQYRDNGAVWITFPYAAEFITVLKDRIPAGCREWHPDRKAWWIHALYAARAIDLMRDWWPSVEVIRPGQHAGAENTRRYWTPPPPPSPPPPREAAYRTLHLLPSAPPELVEAAGRALARIYHPDLKPEHERLMATARMAAVNNALDTLRVGRGAA